MCLIAAGPPEGLRDKQSFDLLDELFVGSGPDIRTQITSHQVGDFLLLQAGYHLLIRLYPTLQWEVCRLNGVALREDQRPLDAVQQLADVPRP